MKTNNISATHALNVRQPFASLIAAGAKICLRGPATDKIAIGHEYGIFASNTWTIRNPVAYRTIIEDEDIAVVLKDQHPIPENEIVAIVRIQAFYDASDGLPKHIKDNLATYSCFRTESSVYELKLVKKCRLKTKRRFGQFVFPIVT